MKIETKMKKQLEEARRWAKMSRESNEPYFLNQMGLLYMQVSIEQIIKYLDLDSTKKGQE